MRDVIDSGIEYERVLCITGQDYPTMSCDLIEDYLYKNHAHNFLVSMNISEYDNAHSLSKIQKYWFYDIPIRNWIIMKCFRKLFYYSSAALYALGVLRKDRYLFVDNEKWNVYFGSDYWCLTKECFEFVYQAMQNKDIIQYFKYSFAPSELVIHTIVSNSKFKDTVDKISPEDYQGLASVTPLQYLIYDEINGTGIKILDIEDYHNIIQSKKPFCRKVQSNKSYGLEDMLDNEMVN